MFCGIIFHMMWIITAVFITLVFIAVVFYNQLVRLRNLFENAYAQIDVQLQRRYDLIPNLVSTAKAYLTHEKETLEAVISARNQAKSAADQLKKTPGMSEKVQQLQKAETGLASSLSRLMLVVEQYPDLKANENMLQLSEDIKSTENKVAFARQAYNDAVMHYNSSREQFPTNIVANFFSFSPAEMLQLENAEARKAPKVTF